MRQTRVQSGFLALCQDAVRRRRGHVPVSAPSLIGTSSVGDPGGRTSRSPLYSPATTVVHRRQGARACSPPPKSLVAYIGENDVEVFDIRFCDLLGIMNHLTVPASTVSVDSLAGGMAFDGSSIKGFQSIHESDMTLLPDVTTARLDPFRRRKTLTCNFFVHDPLTLQPYSRDPRNVARKAEEYLASTGIADTCYFGAEAEFYIFDNVQFEHQHDRVVLQDRLRRGLVEHRPRGRGRQPRLQGPDQGRLLPGPAVRPRRPTCATT